MVDRNEMLVNGVLVYKYKYNEIDDIRKLEKYEIISH
jgi:hypothetical protein